MRDFDLLLKEFSMNIGYSFKDPGLLKQAFTRKSLAEENGVESNEILELIGDKYIGLCITKFITRNYGKIMFNGKMNDFTIIKYDNVGKLTRVINKLVSKKMLSKCMDHLGLIDFLYMNKSDLNNNVGNEESVKEDLFEAIIGAIVIDSNYDFETIEKVILKTLNIDSFLKNEIFEDDYISLVNSWHQKKYGKEPIYHYQKDILLGYLAVIYLETPGGIVSFYTDGKNKKKACENVAKKTYYYLMNNNLLNSIKDDIPKNITQDNAINILNELNQKKYISKPLYDFNSDEILNEKKELIWICKIKIESININLSASSPVKNLAKKQAAYLALKSII